MTTRSLPSMPRPVALAVHSLLLAGGLSALQSATIMSALPFTFILLLMCWGLLKAYQAGRNGWISLDYAAKL